MTLSIEISLRMSSVQFVFPNHLTRLIMTYVRTLKFSISLNEELHGFFASRRGLR